MNDERVKTYPWSVRSNEMIAQFTAPAKALKIFMAACTDADENDHIVLASRGEGFAFRATDHTAWTIGKQGLEEMQRMFRTIGREVTPTEKAKRKGFTQNLYLVDLRS